MPQDSTSQAACHAALCTTATSLIGLLPPTLQPAHLEALDAARQLLQAAVFYAPTTAARTAATVHLAACWGLEGRWHSAAEHLATVEGPLDGDVAMLLQLHAGRAQATDRPLPLAVLRCALHTMQEIAAKEKRLAATAAVDVLQLLVAGLRRTPELSTAPAAQRIQLWRALMALTVTALQSEQMPEQLLQDVARVALHCSKWAVKTSPSDSVYEAALATYECGLVALGRGVPRAAVTLLTVAAAAYGLGGSHQDAACKKTALLLALEAALSLDTYVAIAKTV